MVRLRCWPQKKNSVEGPARQLVMFHEWYFSAGVDGGDVSAILAGASIAVSPAAPSPYCLHPHPVLVDSTIWLSLFLPRLLASWSAHAPAFSLSFVSDAQTNKPSAVLEKLSEQYGPKLMEFVFCCIAASRDGLTMQELEDVCSLNDDVLNEQYERDNVVPQIRRVPQKTWSSLSDALTAHLSVGSWVVDLLELP